MMETRLLAIILLPILVNFSREVDLAFASEENNATSTSYHVVQQWAEKLSFELYNLGDYITRRKQVQEKFKEAQVVSRFGQKIVEDMAKEIKDMMDWKVGTVQKIVEAAQNIAIYNEEEADTSFRYFNSKEMLEPHDKPYVPRKLEVDEKEPLITKPPPKIIELVPHPNFPGLPVNFTYSSVHVPTNVFDRSLDVIKAIQWSEQLDEVFRSNYRDDPTLSWQFFGSSYGFMRQYPASKWKEDPVDLYDCRLRQWYINAANSPKDVIIILDNSGSMTGETKEIAKHVASTILDTLGSNDFVNILTISDDIRDVVACVGDSLVPATMGNIRELKLGLEKINTTKMANFTIILSKAFEILEEYRTDRQGARCNQAIMLISDGVPYKYEEVFEEYNWQNLPYMPVRFFTYLIGRELVDVSQIKWMACENQGFYVHLRSTAEVREEVLNYVHVMARPLALQQNDHPITWTDVYADAEDPKMTDWLWRNKEFETQKERFVSMTKNITRYGLKNKKVQNQKFNDEKYILMTTVSMPVFDLSENASQTAKLLGVAGTDVPISDISKLMRPFMLGVNGYSFIVTNNGYILTHPDLRPEFQKILKPAYNSVDMVEIEQMDDDSEPRAFNPIIMEIREKIINQTTSSKWMIMKYHMDDMKRVSKLKRQYFWTGIKDTPFTLVITYPHEYGVNRILCAEDEFHTSYARGDSSLKYFQGQRWRVHPEWLYCKNRTAQFKTPEEELLHFLREIGSSGWKWPLNRSRPPPVIYCDHGLLQSLVFDARVTEFFSNFSSREDRKMLEFKKRFKVTTAFIATHSGLTRWVEINSNAANQTNREFNFTESNGRAIDEVWYKRAVDQHFIEPDSFVYSVPFDSGNNTETLVTASHAIFNTDGGRSAPVAVVGFNFHHKALNKIFKNITSSCSEANCKTCESNELECYVLDNHGYVILGSDNSTGKFYGDVNNSIMHLLAEERVYKTVKIYDYQGVCFAGKNYSNRVNTAFNSLFEFHNKVAINKTRPETCDQELTLYQLNTDKDTTIYITPASPERPFTVLPIKQSNMILLVVDVLNVIANQSIPVDVTRPVDINYEESLMCHKSFSAMPRKRPTSCTNKHFNENSIKLCGQGFMKTFSFARIIFAICLIQIFYFNLYN